MFIVESDFVRSNLIMVELKLSYVFEMKLYRNKGWEKKHNTNSISNVESIIFG